MSEERITWGTDGSRRFPSLRHFSRWPDGAAYTAERGGRYFIVIDDSSLGAFFTPDRQATDEALSEQVLVIEFRSDDERAEYLRDELFPGGEAGAAPSDEALHQLLGDDVFRRWKDFQRGPHE